MPSSTADKRWTARHLTVLALAVTLASTGGPTGCVFERMAIAEQAKKDLIGLTKKDLYLCAGVPVRATILEDLEILEYVTTKIYGSFSEDCTVFFTLQDGIVRSIRYSDPSGGLTTEGHQCAFVVRDCLSRAGSNEKGDTTEMSEFPDPIPIPHYEEF